MQLVLLMTLHVFISVALIALVLLQRGRGSEMGAAFGSGASGTMFGSQGSTPFMVKLIAGLAVLFFCTSLGLNYFVSKVNTARQPDILDISEPSSAPANVPAQRNLDNQDLLNKSQQLPENKK